MVGRREGSGITRWHISLRVICFCVAALLTVISVESMTMEVEDGDDECVIITANKGNTINANYEILGYPVKNTMVILQRKVNGQLFYKKEGVEEDYFRADATEDGDYELCFINGNEELIQVLRNRNIVEEARLVGLDALRRENKAKLEAQKQDAVKQEGYDATTSYSNIFGLSDELRSSISTMDDWAQPLYAKDSRSKTFGFGLRLGADVDHLESMVDVTREEKDIANFLREEADVLVQTLSVFNDHESYMRGREEYHRENVEQTSTRLMWCTFIEAAVLAWVSWSQLSYIRRFFETKRVL